MHPQKSPRQNPGNRKTDLLHQRQYSLLEPGQWLINSIVWVPSGDPMTVYEEGLVTQFDNLTLTCDVRGVTKTFAYADCRNANAGTDPLAVHDIAKLPHTNDAAVLCLLNVRYINNCIYTYASQLLVAVNPFMTLPGLYDVSTIHKYRSCKDTGLGFTSDLPPHTYAVAQKALTLYTTKRRNQSCIISGESGAGKTETARQLMQFFSSTGHEAQRAEHKGAGSIQDIILGSNPILESFGNAKTLRNNNSSRFGRFVKLDVRPEETGIVAGELSQYMLELSRIDKQQLGERNYHIFYQLCKASTDEQRQRYRLRPIETYTFLNQTGTYDVETVDDLEENQAVRRIFVSLLSNDQVESLYCALSGILLCGNVTFINAAKLGTDMAAEVSSHTEIRDVAELLGVPEDQLTEACTTKTTEIRAQQVVSPLTAEQAVRVCGTIAKEAYSALFRWLVTAINNRIRGPHEEMERWIGILDIYGFEYFETNSLEQLLINYANEKLQQFFVRCVFHAEKELYEAEGIDHLAIVYQDNQEVITLLDAKKPASILTLLEQQCLLPTGTSGAFTHTAHQAFGQHSLYGVPRLNADRCFIIRHTAAPVMYTTTEFVVKNSLRMPAPITNLLRSSKNVSLKEAFALLPSCEDARSLRGSLVASQFSTSMEKLLLLLDTSTAHFIRCVKPNQLKRPRFFVAEEVLAQLHCLSVLEAVDLVQKGFAYKATHRELMEDNPLLVQLTAADVTDPQDVVKAVLSRLQVPQDTWQMGKTRIFLKKTGWLRLTQFLKQLTGTLQPLVLRIQGAYQSYQLRRKFDKRTETVQRLQSVIRRFPVLQAVTKRQVIPNLLFGTICVLKLLNIRALRRASAIYIQKHVRRFLVQRRYAIEIGRIHRAQRDTALRNWVRGFLATRRWKQHREKARQRRAVLHIQRVWRGHVARKRARRYRRWRVLKRSATKIQALFRGHRVRKIYRAMLYLKPYAITIQRFWRGYRERARAPPRLAALRARLALLAQLRLRATRVQTVARTHLVQLRVDRLLQSALVLQSISLTRILRNQLEGVRWACLTIQSWWRGDRTRRVIREEKLKMLTRCTAMSAQAYEDAQCTALLRAARGKSRSPGLQLIHVDVSVEPRTVYPHGWVEGLLNLSRPQAPEPIAQVTCGAFHTVVLTRTGHLYGYGLNDKSQLGLSQDRAQPPGLAFPERIAIRRPIQRVTCGADHTLALTVDGTVYAWGDNTRGQCGTRAATSIVSIPHQVRFHKRSEPVTYVSAGYFHSAALVGGELWVWGRHDHLHLASLYNDIRTPLRVADTPSCIIAEVGSLCRVECGLACTFLLNDYGELFVFGHPKSTTLGIGSNSDHRRDAYKLKEPQQVVDFRVGTNFVVAVTSNGDVWQWGTFLEWDPCIAQATKVTYLDPVPVPAGALGDERAEECGVGWWEVVIRCRSGRLLGWSIWKHAAERDSKHSFSPHVYQFNLTKNKHVKHVQVASCPSLTAVLCEMTGKGETAGKKEYAFAS